MLLKQRSLTNVEQEMKRAIEVTKLLRLAGDQKVIKAPPGWKGLDSLELLLTPSLIGLASNRLTLL